ncbi:Transcriptional regulatory protein RXT2 [Candida viswanathii]|uniref:Transcriptional regulatory protein RXT2 n=1 Tax=Candida viswanathii TaxID=5486 RepID=A0A367Y0I6_9ASCO|nr:Transcriptional regulatory protein RXT2 [Candida viswanathii]
MLDSTSLEVIARFKQALLNKQPQASTSDPKEQDKTPIEGTETLPVYNRGLKLLSARAPPSLDVLRPKTTEYDGKKYVVLTNETIEGNNLRSKRKWRDTYGDKQAQDEEELGLDGETKADDDEDEDEVHPLKKSRIVELLAPLNHPSEIITHPAISKTYKLQTLGKLAYELIELIEIEQNNLNWLNKLLQVLNGEDWFYLLEENLGLKDYDHGLDEEKKKKIEAKQPVADEFEDEEENAADPFFALPTALKRYETYQQSLEANDPLKEDLINYLQVSIQRQHEYIKNLTLLRNGLVRADRLKKDLHKWGKEMYDKKSN